MEHKTAEPPRPPWSIKATVYDSLFNGTLYLVQIIFRTPGGDHFVGNTDMTTVLNYMKSAIIPISGYVLQYGHNSLNVSNSIIILHVNLASNTYNNNDLIAWVNNITSFNNLPIGSSCVVILNPLGMTNTDADRQSVGGFHDKANIPFCFCNVYAHGGFSFDDTQNAYAQMVSHEIAEMTVDPNADISNPEVCDACSGNCDNVWLDFFNKQNQFIGGSQSLVPSSQHIRARNSSFA